MREDEEHTESIMRHEADIPPVLDEAGGRARREVPPGVDAEIGPCENEDRIHVTQHVKGEVAARSDLEICRSRCWASPYAARQRRALCRSGKEECHQQRLHDLV